MINPDFSTLSIFRIDGRKTDELRSTKIELGVNPSYDGSCLLRHGLTQVLCLIRGPYQKYNIGD
jgi:ribonuclease PH